MTCQDLRDRVEGDVRATNHLSSELAEHVGTCPECGRFIDDRKLLATHLDRVRAAVPAIPASLDTAVIANYRRHMAERAVVSGAHSWRFNVQPALFGAIAVAFAVAVAYAAIAFFAPGEPAGWASRQRGAPPAQAPAPISANKEIPPRHRTSRKPREATQARAHRGEMQAMEGTAGSTLSPTFQSLVYCDQISCPGALEIIRLQLSSPALGITAEPGRQNRIISADVLVGADGIARGIRVVE
jgi:hypothetical protein